MTWWLSVAMNCCAVWSTRQKANTNVNSMDASNTPPPMTTDPKRSKREIKFRVWDGTAMYDATEYPDWTLGDFANAFRMAPEYRPDPERYKLMQYTGLKDKNGKEIYEGDIMEITHPKEGATRGVIEYSDDGGRFLWFAHEDSGYGLTSRDRANEVIGNIYENPELLKP